MRQPVASMVVNAFAKTMSVDAYDKCMLETAPVVSQVKRMNFTMSWVWVNGELRWRMKATQLRMLTILVFLWCMSDSVAVVV